MNKQTSLYNLSIHSPLPHWRRNHCTDILITAYPPILQILRRTLHNHPKFWNSSTSDKAIIVDSPGLLTCRVSWSPVLFNFFCCSSRNSPSNQGPPKKIRLSQSRVEIAVNTRIEDKGGWRLSLPLTNQIVHPSDKSFLIFWEFKLRILAGFLCNSQEKSIFNFELVEILNLVVTPNKTQKATEITHQTKEEPNFQILIIVPWLENNKK